MIRSSLAAVLALLAVTPSAAPGGAATGGPGSRPRTLKVITYNVQFLPGLARVINKRKQPTYRARTIGKALTGFDVVGLNETFDDRSRELLLDQLRAAWGKDFNVVLSPKPDDSRLTGGCAIASRLPFLETHGTLYSAASDPKTYGILADGFAAKGAIHARIALSRSATNPDFIDVFATHLESKDDAAREVQYKELAAFVRAHGDPGRPVLILGDLNTHGNARARRNPRAQYHTMMSILNTGRPGIGVEDIWLRVNPTDDGGTGRQVRADGGSRIDYILLSNPRQGRPRLKPLAMRVNRFLDARVVALSDHSAVEADFEWQQP